MLWGLLRILVRLHWVSQNAAQVFQLAVLVLICEGIRTRMSIPVFMAPWLKALELALMALLTVQVVVKLYIGQYLERHRRVFVARIIRDLTTVRSV